MKRLACEECGSHNLHLEAEVQFNPETEELEAQGLSYALCWECDTEVEVKVVEVAEGEGE